MVKSTELTIKQEKFCQKYIELEGNASEAYRQSYDCKNSGEATINNEAYLLLQNPDIALRIKELEGLHLARHKTTIDRVVAEYAKLAFLDARKAFYPDGSLKPLNELDDETAAAIAGLEIEEKIIGEETFARIKKIKLADKKGSLDSLAKYLSMFVDKVEHSGNITLSDLVSDSYKKPDEK